MRLRDTQQIPPAERRHSNIDRELVELAHRTGQPQSTWARVAPVARQGLLARLRTTKARQVHAQTQAFRQQLAQALSPDRQAPR